MAGGTSVALGSIKSCTQQAAGRWAGSNNQREALHFLQSRSLLIQEDATTWGAMRGQPKSLTCGM